MALGLAGWEGAANAWRRGEAAALGLAGVGLAEALKRGIGALGLTELGLPVVAKHGVMCSPAAQDSSIRYGLEQL